MYFRPLLLILAKQDTMIKIQSECLIRYWLMLLLFGNSILVSAQVADIKDRLQNEYQIKINKTEENINIDGRLDEAVWKQAYMIKNFWMSFPEDDRRADANLQTEVQMAYDDQFIYIAATCYQPNDFRITTLKRDNGIFWRGDVFGVLIDPVNKSTNGFGFSTNPAGVQYESLISGRTGTRADSGGGNSAFNTAWDNKWYVETQMGTDRWTLEMAIPFKSLRYEPNLTTWGINFIRGEPRGNAWHTWSPVPVQFLTFDLGYTGALVWDTPPVKVKSNISLIPYVLGSVEKDFEEQTDTDYEGRIGVDGKVAITPTLNLDVTINPDFSQVDVDEQVTNLSTFNIRFPERRLFFLENSDVFANFGIPPMRPFFSRKIGLDEDGGTIPIAYGLRLSGNLNNDLRVGVMNMQTREQSDYPGQNYTTVALHRRVLERSVIKGYFNNRQGFLDGEINGDNYNRTAGLAFQYFSQDAKWQGFGGYGQSFSDGLSGDNYFYNVGGGYDGRSWSIYSNVSGIGDQYYADMGWIPFAEHYDANRDTTIHVGFQHTFTRVTYTIYPESGSKIQTHRIALRHILDVDNNLDLLHNRIRFNYSMNFANSSSITVGFNHDDKQLLFPFDFTDEEPLPAGRYHFSTVSGEYQSDQRGFFSWRASLEYGGFYNGNLLRTSLRANYRVQPWGNFGVNFVYNKLDLPTPYGDRNLFLISPKIEVNFSRNLFWTTFLQYNTQQDNFNINSRLQWRYRPLSDLFIVYSDNYAVEIWGKKNRALVLKCNYWLNL